MRCAFRVIKKDKYFPDLKLIQRRFFQNIIFFFNTSFKHYALEDIEYLFFCRMSEHFLDKYVRIINK